MNPAFIEYLLAPPARVVAPLSWAGHIPFAMLLIRLTQPRLLVELGTHSGNSFNAFCQAVAEADLPTRCVAVDTWAGDHQAGVYGPEILANLQAHQMGRYDRFATLRQTTFDLAREDFADGSIDVLHIDGLHTYAAVRHDFEYWQPKLSARAVVLFHDIAVREGDFGVWRFWEEASGRYPSLAFAHAHGLGVLVAGTHPPAELLAIIAEEHAGRGHLRALCARLGTALTAACEAGELRSALAATQHRLAATEARATELHTRLVQAEQFGDDLERRVREQRHGYEAHIADLEAQLADWRQRSADGTAALAALQASHSWRLTQPLRSATTAARRGVAGLATHYRVLPASLRGCLRPVLRPLRLRLLGTPDAPLPLTRPAGGHYAAAAARVPPAPATLHFNAAPQPAFSVCLAAHSPAATLRCLAALLPQCAAFADELLVCGMPDCLAALAPLLTGVRWCPCASPDPAARWIGRGEETRSDWLLCVSDECVPLPGMVDALWRTALMQAADARVPVAAKLVSLSDALIYPWPAADALAPDLCHAQSIASPPAPLCLLPRTAMAAHPAVSNEQPPRLPMRWQPLAEALWLGQDCPPAAHATDSGPRLLIVDLLTPTPDRDSGSVDAFFQMQLALELGLRVSFLPGAQLACLPGYTADLQRLGVECLYPPATASVAGHLRAAGRRYAAVMVSRLAAAEQWLDPVRRECPQAKTIFNTVDLHFVREARQAQVEGDAALARVAERTRTAELRAMRQADATLVISATEAALVREAAPDVRCFQLPLTMAIEGRVDRPFADRRDVFFIGGFKHRPNVDAVLYFVRDVWPAIAARLPAVRFLIVGSDPPAEVRALAGERVVVTGFVADAAPFFNGCRLSLAPLRFGAGLKGKVGRSFGYGCPVVATPLALEGMALGAEEGALAAADAAAFVEATLRAYTDEALWQRLAASGRTYFERHFSLEAGRAQLASLFSTLGVLPS